MNIREKSLVRRRNSNDKNPEAKGTWGVGGKSKELRFPGGVPQETVSEAVISTEEVY